MKSYAELKREVGSLEFRMVYRFGKDIPELWQGWRKGIRSNSTGIYIRNNLGKESMLAIKSAKLVEYDGEKLTLYGAGLRDLTEQERRIMDEWHKISEKKEFRERVEYDALTDGSSTYWQEKYFFEKHDALYLMGQEQRGCMYDYNTGKIRDNKVKGDIELRYEVRKAQN